MASANQMIVYYLWSYLNKKGFQKIHSTNTRSSAVWDCFPELTKTVQLYPFLMNMVDHPDMGENLEW